VAETVRTCPTCGEPLPPGSRVCPVCSLLKTPARAALIVTAPSPAAGDEDGEDEVWEARLNRLRGWAEAGPVLGVVVPDLPAWAEEFSREPAERRRWQKALRELEAAAQERVLTAVEERLQQIEERIRVLTSYSVDSRLETEGVREALAAVPRGDPDELIAAYRQLDRVVSLKERHLEQARTDLEELMEFLAEVKELDLGAVPDPVSVEREFDSELRKGRLVPLKQWLRRIRSEAQSEARAAGPARVRSIGRTLAEAKARGEEVGAASAALARAARAFSKDETEAAVHALAEIPEGYREVPAPVSGGRRKGSG
jgi:Asp-tRNA(Asn)/Glu-tRNA(Gln) amidotransferase C subunit